MILGSSLLLVPLTQMKVTDVGVQRLCKQGTGGDGSLGIASISWFVVSLREEKSIERVKLFNGCIVDVIDYTVE